MLSHQAASLFAPSLPRSSVLKEGAEHAETPARAKHWAWLGKGHILQVCVTAHAWTGLAGSWGSVKERGGDGGMSQTRRHDFCVRVGVPAAVK